MVLPVRIELTTSALPRMRSTTELRQHSRQVGDGRAPKSGSARDCQGVIGALARLHDPACFMTKPDDRAARLAEQLRANLRRRKAQARAGREEADASAIPTEPRHTPE